MPPFFLLQINIITSDLHEVTYYMTIDFFYRHTLLMLEFFSPQFINKLSGTVALYQSMILYVFELHCSVTRYLLHK